MYKSKKSVQKCTNLKKKTLIYLMSILKTHCKKTYIERVFYGVPKYKVKWQRCTPIRAIELLESKNHLFNFIFQPPGSGKWPQIAATDDVFWDPLRSSEILWHDDRLHRTVLYCCGPFGEAPNPALWHPKYLPKNKKIETTSLIHVINTIKGTHTKNWFLKTEGEIPFIST